MLPPDDPMALPDVLSLPIGLLIGSALLVGCSESTRGSAPSAGESSSPPAPAQSAPVMDPPELTVTGPEPSGPFAPSLALAVPGAPPSGSELADVAACEPCHAAVVDQWRTSAHAFSSFTNPLYRLSVETFRETRDKEASRFCGGCHDPALLVDGALDQRVDPADPRAHVGVSCRVCHGIVEAGAHGNASYTLRGGSVPLPIDGDDESHALHVAAMTPAPLRTDELCGTCHQVFLSESTGHPYLMAGVEDMNQWRRSYYGKSPLSRVGEAVAPRSCGACHMPMVSAELPDAAADDGQVASHRFIGGHTYLAAMRRDDSQIERVREMLRGAATIDIAVASTARGTRGLPAERLELVAGDEVVLGIVVFNDKVGHHFPGGTRDLQDTWVEIDVVDRAGRRIAEAGLRHAATGADPTAHRLRLELVDDQGRALREHEVARFRAAAFDHTVKARGARVIEAGFRVPDDVGPDDFPLRIEARLLHRSRPFEHAIAACSFQDSEDGRRLRSIGGADACVAQPVTRIAETSVELGKTVDPRPLAWRRAAGRRLTDHGLGMLEGLHERLGEAESSLLVAIELLGQDEPARGRAEVMSLLGEVTARQGRTSDSLAWLDRVDELYAGHPATRRIRGLALTEVWRFDEALPHLRAAFEAAPGDDEAAARLALALGSLGRAREAFDVSRAGLSVQPRSSHLLRVQSLSLAALGVESDVARETYLTFRGPDSLEALRSACHAETPGCRLERIPVHVHEMRQDR